MKDIPLAQFRAQLYTQLHLYNRADVTMDTVDTLASAVGVRSPVELVLLPAFRERHYSALYQAIGAFPLSESALLRLFIRHLPPAQARRFHLFSVDTTPHPRPYAQCLEDREYVHAPTPVPGQKPVTIGHRYSLLAYLPEKAYPQAPPWSPFLSARRVTSQEDPEMVGRQQVHPAPTAEILILGDSRYSKPAFVYPLVVEDQTNVLVRLRHNRVVYTAPAVPEEACQGHPCWYGEPFALDDPTTWPEPDVEVTWSGTTKKGRQRLFHAQAWYEMRLRGQHTYPMQRCPFTLVRIVVTTPEGEPVYRHPLWLALFGPRRRALSLQEIYAAYVQRFDQEHGQRFVKQHLLATAYQTPQEEQERRWWQLVLSAYFQLWLARDLARQWLRPWEKYLPQWREPEAMRTTQVLSPALVQRDFDRIIRQMGTPARQLNPRGNPRGRAKGTRLPRRQQLPVVRKGRSRA